MLAVQVSKVVYHNERNDFEASASAELNLTYNIGQFGPQGTIELMARVEKSEPKHVYPNRVFGTLCNLKGYLWS